MVIVFILLCCSVTCVVSASTLACKLQDDTNGTCINLNDLRSDIGKLRLNETSSHTVRYIVGGLRTVYKEFPYMVALGWESLLSDDSYDYKCGGVLISPKYVLTAAHCAVLNGLSPSVALVGGSNLTDSKVKPIQISKAITHPGYKQSESYNDIALLQLKSRSLERPISAWNLKSTDDLNVTAIGYGHTQFAGVGSDSLLKTYLSIVLNEDCTKYYSNEAALPRGVIDKQICAKDLEHRSDTCQGDSGGPLVLYTKDSHGIPTPFVVGITSFGQACALDPPGVYTRVSEYIDWIESVVNEV